jgi:predicted DNA-binding transcriptional regulator AlpA
MRYLRHEDLSEKGITYSKAQLWRLRKLPPDDPRKFPDPVKGLGPVDVWTEPSLDEYIERRIAAAREAEAA